MWGWLTNNSAVLSPFVVLGAVALLYFVVSDSTKQAAMRRDINFYMICIVVVAFMSIIANVLYGKNWIDAVVWALAVIAIGLVIWRHKQTVPVTDQDQPRGPLEQAGKR